MGFHIQKASQSGTSAPTSLVPEFIGQVYVDTTGPTLYISHGTSAGNWTEAESGTLSAHDIGGSSHNADTLANLNTKISDDNIIGANTFDANTILKADSDNTPAALTVAEQRVVGRITSGVITALTAAEVRTLINVEDGADVTDSTNVDAAGAVMNADTSTAAMGFVIDEDTMVSDSDTKVPTQQSVKAYVDAAVASEVTYKGGYNAATNTPDLDTSPSGVAVGDMYTVTAAGTFFTTAVEIGDVLIAEADDASTEAEWTIVNKNLDAASIKTAYESNSDTNAFTDAEKTKLTGIEDSADVTDATNVAAAGAVMEADTTTASMSFVLDEDDMASDSDTKLATQQSIKAYAQASGDDYAVKVYAQAAQPTLSADNVCAFWKDTDDSNRVYLMFRRGTGDHVGVELT